MSGEPALFELRDAMPFAALLGIELLTAGPGRVRGRGRLAWAPERCTAGGILHGGAIMALADTCGGACSFLNLPAQARATSTIASTTNFLRAVRAGAVIATSEPLHIGRTLIVIQTEVSHEDESAVAHVIQTQGFYYPRPRASAEPDRG
ncbi:MAG: PaaI family thioesterase [Trebonia sp.]